MSKSGLPQEIRYTDADNAFSKEQLRQIELQNKLQELIIREKEASILGSKIEHARRNIDALTHINIDGSCKDVKPVVLAAMLKNIEILAGAKDIK